MWKALIKLVESWSYRCDHDWIKEGSITTETRFGPGHYCKNKIITYRCTKCCETRSVKI